jgi:uncharacterized membrane protein
MSDYQLQSTRDARAVNLVYILNFIGYITIIPWIIAVIIAYAKRDEAAGPERSHFNYQIQTFWGEVILFLIGILTTFILIGFVILFAAFIWSIARNVTGFITASNGYGVRYPKSWGLAQAA